MSKLTTERRKELPGDEFLGPHRSFPVPDAEHARKAIQLAPRSEAAGNISASTEHEIVAKARRKLAGFEGTR